MKKPKTADGKPSVDVYQLVTTRIIEALKEGTIPWRKTWKGHSGFAQNYLSKRPYKGINALLTNLSPFDIPYFLTMRQANGLGGKVRKGAKSLPIVFWKFVYRDSHGNDVPEEEARKREDVKKRSMIRYYRVFNISDIEGITFDLPQSEPSNFNPIKSGEQLVAKMPLTPPIKHLGSQPFYSPPRDLVQVPDPASFESAEAYYATLFHELIHSTGHTKRLNRPEVMESDHFGSLTYSKEELTAEIGAAFLCQITGISLPELFENSVSYIQGWLSKLQDDRKFIFYAASQAKKAVAFITE